MNRPIPGTVTVAASALHNLMRKIVGRRHYFSNWQRQFGSDDDSCNAFAIFPKWTTEFRSDGRRYGAETPLVSDQDHRIAECNRLEPVKDRSVVELGPLESGHSKQLADLGAARVVGIESHPEAYLRCLVAKEALGFDRVRFVFGDFNKVLSRWLSSGQTFDICSAIGVLYHMQRPLEAIDLITRIAPVTYVWTQVASERAPKGEWVSLSDQAGRNYRGRVNYYGRGAHLGGLAASSVWLAEESMVRAFSDRGFAPEIIERTPDHVNGECITFVARRSPAAPTPTSPGDS